MRTKAEARLVQLPAEEQWTPLEATGKLGGGNADFVPRPFRWRLTLPTPWSWTSGSKSMKERISVVWRSPLCSSLLWQPEQGPLPVRTRPNLCHPWLFRETQVLSCQTDSEWPCKYPILLLWPLARVAVSFFCFPIFLKKLFIYLAVLGLIAACMTFDLCCDMWNLKLWHAGSSSLMKDWTWAPCVGRVESQPLDTVVVHCFPILKTPSTFWVKSRQPGNTI